jgi:hypothetical protein
MCIYIYRNIVENLKEHLFPNLYCIMFVSLNMLLLDHSSNEKKGYDLIYISFFFFFLLSFFFD